MRVSGPKIFETIKDNTTSLYVCLSYTETTVILKDIMAIMSSIQFRKWSFVVH